MLFRSLPCSVDPGIEASVERLPVGWEAGYAGLGGGDWGGVVQVVRSNSRAADPQHILRNACACCPLEGYAARCQRGAGRGRGQYRWRRGCCVSVVVVLPRSINQRVEASVERLPIDCIRLGNAPFSAAAFSGALEL